MVNAFWLDEDLAQTARWLVDTHVTSSVLENAMVLTTAAQDNGYPDDSDDLYYSHSDHPLTRWAAESYPNWQRLRAYTEAAHDEWRYRWDHGEDEDHASWAVVKSLDSETMDSLDWPAEAERDPPQVTGEWTADSYVDAYRYYYANEKRHLFSWSKDRSEPPWIDEYTVDSGTKGADADGSSGDDSSG